MERQTLSLSQELEAMATLGQVLGNLSDPAARQRVLKWAAERFAVELPTGMSPTAAAVATPDRAAIDSALAVDSLEDMFSARCEDVSGDLSFFETPAPETAKAPIEVVLRSFAADFQRFTDEWNGANA